MSDQIIFQCAYCGATVETPNGLRDKAVVHGTCFECLEAVKAEPKKMQELSKEKLKKLREAVSNENSKLPFMVDEENLADRVVEMLNEVKTEVEKVLIPHIDIRKGYEGLCDLNMLKANESTTRFDGSEALNQMHRLKRMVYWFEGKRILKINDNQLLAWSERLEDWGESSVDFVAFLNGTFLNVKQHFIDIERLKNVKAE